VDLPLRPIANRFCGCFCLGPGPVFCLGFGVLLLFASSFPLAKRKSGWGICRSSLFVWWLFSLSWFNRFSDFKDFVSLYRVSAAYSHVRTEPLARHRPHSRKKKMYWFLWFLCFRNWQRSCNHLRRKSSRPVRRPDCCRNQTSNGDTRKTLRTTDQHHQGRTRPPRRHQRHHNDKLAKRKKLYCFCHIQPKVQARHRKS